MEIVRARQALVIAAATAAASLCVTSSASAQWWSYLLRRSTPTPVWTAARAPATPTASPTHTASLPPTRTATATRIPTRTATPEPTQSNPQAVSLAPNGPPAQKLAAALLVFPLIQSQTTTKGVTQDTRVELLNMTGTTQSLQCFYLRSEGWVELGFFVTLTAHQPLSWLASAGTRNIATFTSVPPFYGEGELKCGVIPNSPELRHHNVVQGRALVFDDDGQAASYSAVAFRRLVPGAFEGVFRLDGQTYEKCPDRLHFDVLAIQSGSASEIVLVPCDQNFATQTATTVTAQFQIINEFEQSFSASIGVTCWDRRPLDRVSSTLMKSTLGTDTAHVIVRGAQSSLIGLVLDKFSPFGRPVTTGNEPFLEGGRNGTVTFPY